MSLDEGQGGFEGEGTPNQDAQAKSRPNQVVEHIEAKPKGRPNQDPVVVNILRVNLIQLSKVDQLTQTFTARYFWHFRIEGGALDPDLIADIDDDNPVFPKDTLRPGARWFLNQMDFPTAFDHQLSRAKVVQMGEHLDLVFVVSGTFHSTMALQHFPVDVQSLGMVLACNCAKEGIVPIHFNTPPDLVATVSHDNFAMSNLWKLHDRAMLSHCKQEPMPGTTYPAVRVSAMVVRLPVYFYINVIVPMSTLTFMALFQFALPAEQKNSNVTFRITYSITILLTTATYKLFIATALPIGLSYMTLLDKYVLFCYLLQVTGEERKEM